MTVRLLRVFFLVLSTVCGYYLWSVFHDPEIQGSLVGAAIGGGGALAIILVEANMKKVSLRNLSAAAFGMMFGFFMASILTRILRLIPMGGDNVYAICQVIFTLIFCYLGMVIAMKGKDEFNLIIPYVRFAREEQGDTICLLDTSVIIDGRIEPICETGFLSGKLIVPRFVLQELHQVADSADDSKRTRGRRGLDMLEKLKSLHGVEIIVHDEGLPEIKGVDAKLVRLAKMLSCHILTNDYNLNKVAKLEGVSVLNINDLSGALRPVVFPGERITVQIKREGKERNQGVAFLDDGTMIVVDNARKFLGKAVETVVTSVLQTAAGKMIFAELTDKNVQEKENGAYNRPRQDSRPPRQDSRPPRQDSRPPRQDSRPPRRDNRSPRQENKPQVQENQPQVQENKPQEQENKPQAQENQPQVQENQPQVQENKPPVQENQQPQEGGTEGQEQQSQGQ